MIKHILTLCLCLTVSTIWSQTKTARDYIRSGNRLYRDSLYTKAETDYRKAIELDSHQSEAQYNLGNALLRQAKPKEAMQAYEDALSLETDKERQASIYHNMGVILQNQKQFAPAIECYKNALRRSPNDNETRYNLVLCQHQLQEQDGSNNNNQQQDQQQNQESNQENQDNNQENQDNNQEQAQESENMSQENAEQILNAAMEDEKDTQERIRKATAEPRQRRLLKQW